MKQRCAGCWRQRWLTERCNPGAAAAAVRDESEGALITVNITEARMQLSRLIKCAEAGEEIVIARAGKSVARLIPFRRVREPRRGGQWRGKVNIRDDFNDLPSDISVAFGANE